MRTGNILN